MAADARGDDDTLLRHGFEGLEGCHQLGQAHRDSREYHKIRQIVVPLHLFMRDPSCKDDALAQTEPRLQSAVWDTRSSEGLAIDRIGDDGDLVAGNTAADHISPQALADRC